MKLFGKRLGQKEVKNDTTSQKPAVVNIGSVVTSGAAKTDETSNTQVVASHPNPGKNSKFKNKRFLVVAGAVVTIGLFGILIVNREDFTNFAKGNRCGQKDIERHNQAIKSTDNFANNVKAVALEVESKKGYTKDVTCVFIVYQHYSYAQDVDKSRQLLEIIKTLEKQGKRIDKRMVGIRTIEQMEMYVKSLEHNRDIGDKADGSG